MAETLVTADGRAVPLEDPAAAEKAFEKAMAAPEPAPGGSPDYPPPRRRRDPEAPFGRNPDGSPLAPHGIGANGRPRQNPPGPGRGGKDRKPRDRAGQGTAPAEPGPDLTPELAEFTDGLWMLLAGTPVPWPKMADFKIRLRVQAAVLKENQAGVVGALALGARKNATVRRYVEMVTSGSASWVLPAMFMITPFVAQTASLWRSEITGELREVANGTEAEWKKFSEDQMTLMATAAAAAAEVRAAEAPR